MGDDNIFDVSITEKQRLIWYLLNDLSPKRSFTFNEIEKEMGYNNPMPQLRAFFRSLIEKGYFNEAEKTRNGYPKYKFNKKKYIDDYEKSLIFIYNAKHIKSTRLIWDNL